MVTTILLGAALIGLSFTPLGIAAFAGGSGAGDRTVATASGVVNAGLYAAGAFGSSILGILGTPCLRRCCAAFDTHSTNTKFRRRPSKFFLLQWCAAN